MPRALWLTVLLAVCSGSPGRVCAGVPYARSQDRESRELAMDSTLQEARQRQGRMPPAARPRRAPATPT